MQSAQAVVGAQGFPLPRKPSAQHSFGIAIGLQGRNAVDKKACVRHHLFADAKLLQTTLFIAILDEPAGGLPREAQELLLLGVERPSGPGAIRRRESNRSKLRQQLEGE